VKKAISLLVLALFATAVFAQEFTVTGEMKTGILWTKYEDQLNNPKEDTIPGSKDDAGTGPGRFRMNTDFFLPDLNVGFKFRINWENWNLSGDIGQAPAWSYAFGYAKFLDRQVTMSFGRLGDSPWGTGGPEMWQELESVANTGGIRFEVEPHAVPGLNVGFVLNGFNGTREAWGQKAVPLYQYLAESVVGASYTSEWFLARAAIRFDSPVDNSSSRDTDGYDGEEVVYRVEEYMLNRYVPGLQLWAMGYIYGIGASKDNRAFFKTQNWLYAQYNPELFTAQVRFGLDAVQNMNTLHIKPSFYFKFFNNLLQAGASFEYTRYFFSVDNTYKNSWYHIIELRPLVQVNISSNIYAALEYSFMRQYQSYYGTAYETGGLEPIVQSQWFNIRVGISF